MKCNLLWIAMATRDRGTVKVNGKQGGTVAADADLVPNAVSVYPVGGRTVQGLS